MAFSCFDNRNYDYNALVNKPTLNGCELQGDMSLDDMGIDEIVACCAQAYAECCIYPYVESELCNKQDLLCPGQGICLDCNEISVAADSTLDCESTNAIQNCAVYSMCGGIIQCIHTEACCITCQLDCKQDILTAGSDIKIENNEISVCTDSLVNSMSCKPVMSCAVKNAIDGIVTCTYTEGCNICIYEDACGCNVVKLKECVDIECCLTVHGEANVCGPLVVYGDIYQCGSSYCTHAEEVYSCCDCIYLRDGNASPLGFGTSGFVVLNYNGTDCAIIAVDETGTWRLGETDGDPNQVIATRAETSCTENNALAVWNCACQCFDTTHSADNQVLTWDDSCVTSLSRSCNSNHTKLKGEITNADTVTMHDYASFTDLECDLMLEDREFSRYDNVAGVNCSFDVNHVYNWLQAGCCVAYSYLVPGSYACAKDTIELSADLIGLTGLTCCSTTCCSTGDVCYSININLAASNYDYLGFPFCSVDHLLCNPLEAYSATATTGCCLLFSRHFIPDTSGTLHPGYYISGNLTDMPSIQYISTQTLCYYIDDLGTYCADCEYFCYDSGSNTYCDVTVDADTYTPSTYYFNCVTGSSVVTCYDLNFLNINCVATPVCVNCFPKTSGPICNIILKQYLTCGDSIDSACKTPDTMCCIRTVKQNIQKINFDFFMDGYNLDVCAVNNGVDYLVHSYGLPCCYVAQERVYKGKTEARYYCDCEGGWQPWSSLPSLTDCVVPCASTLCGSVGTSNEAARADHTHPYNSNFYEFTPLVGTCLCYFGSNACMSCNVIYHARPYYYEWGTCWCYGRNSDSSYTLEMYDCCLFNTNTGHPVIYHLTQADNNDYTWNRICNKSNYPINIYYYYSKRYSGITSTPTYGSYTIQPNELFEKCSMGNSTYGFQAVMMVSHYCICENPLYQYFMPITAPGCAAQCSMCDLKNYWADFTEQIDTGHNISYRWNVRCCNINMCIVYYPYNS